MNRRADHPDTAALVAGRSADDGLAPALEPSTAFGAADATDAARRTRHHSGPAAQILHASSSSFSSSGSMPPAPPSLGRSSSIRSQGSRL